MDVFIPIHLSAFDRSPALGKWIKSWTSSSIIFLEPCDWFDTAVLWKGGANSKELDSMKEVFTLLWSPPPFAVDGAILPELRKFCTS